MININVDVDNLWIYEEEYGVAGAQSYAAMYEQAMPQLLELFARHGVKATFFVVGRDLQLAACRSFCQEAVRLGHELGNHTYSHSIRLHRMSRAEKEREIIKGGQVLEDASGAPVVGFRAPGYYLDDDIVAILMTRGYLYDSSILPGVSNALMKLYITLSSGRPLDKAFGRRRYAFVSRKTQIIRSAQVPGATLYEVPIATLPLLRWPIHSTFLYLHGSAYFRLAAWMLSWLRGPHVYLLHGVDALAYPDGGPLASEIWPLRWPFAKRLQLLELILSTFATHGTFTTTAATVRAQMGRRVPQSYLLSGGMRPHAPGPELPLRGRPA